MRSHPWALIAAAVVLVTVSLLGVTDPGPVRVAGPHAAEATVSTSPPVTVPPPTTAVPVPPVRAQRASRAATAPRVAPVRESAPVVAGDCNAWGWVRTRAQSDACWRAEFAKYGGWDVNKMLRITYCESKGDPWSGRRYVGLLQVDRAESTRGNGPANIALGHSIWLRQGYGAWPVCQHRG